ncbi:hypothetical protein J437_LFUL014174 [Ladona fulva]|uniref:Uncharacterized protein n=1 Tax=Ladona fulva TaxID=123851 RepID=A0A8K0P2U7_LADFU|nr:hypothetical protein J437_LFUL014174 [Ladona fulva]
MRKYSAEEGVMARRRVCFGNSAKEGDDRDSSRAFDTVPHDTLIAKLEKLDIDRRIVIWIKNFLIDRTQKI